MNCVIFVKDLLSFVFLWNNNAQACDFLKGEDVKEHWWCRLKESHLKWGWLTQDGSTQQASNERDEKKEKSLLDVLNHFTLGPAKGLIGHMIGLCTRSKYVNGNTLDCRHIETYTHGLSQVSQLSFLNKKTRLTFCDDVQLDK